MHLEEDTGKTLHVGGATGRIHGADHSLVDYNRAGIPLVEIVTRPVLGTGAQAPAVGPRVRDRAARGAALARRVRRTDGAGLAALRREHVADPGRRDGVGHPHRDQERQLAALGRAGGPVRDRAGRPPCWTRAAGSSRRPGTSTRTPATPRPGAARRRRPTTATSPSPTWCRWRRTRRGSRELRAALPGAAGAAAGPAAAEAGRDRPRHAVDGQRRRGRADRGDRRGRAPRRPRPASGGWASWPGGPTRPASSWPRSDATPAQVARAAARWSTRARCNDKLARPCLEGVLAGEGVAGRGRGRARARRSCPTRAR